jgi:hypothetical protein
VTRGLAEAYTPSTLVRLARDGSHARLVALAVGTSGAKRTRRVKIGDIEVLPVLDEVRVEVAADILSRPAWTTRGPAITSTGS